MLKRSLVVLLTASLLVPALPAQSTRMVEPKEPWPTESTPATNSAVELPVRRVVLYKNGVGYFEHSGHVRGSQELEIKFTTAQLNDVLKSLTIVDGGGGQVSGVRYNSIAPLSERLSTLRIPLGENASREDFLRAMRGARVEVRSGTASAIGRLLSVDKVTRTDKNDYSYEVYELSVMTDGSDLRTFELTPATSVRFTEPELNKEVARYMALVASSRAKDVRVMNIGTTGTGDRQVAVSYISEVPVWKSTYRVVLADRAGEKALLQGWAIVDNTVGEDWKDVQLTLVAGAPQSFIQQISQPLYMRRPTVGLPTTAMLTPQTHEGTIQEDKDEGASGGEMGGMPPPPAAMSAPMAMRKSMSPTTSFLAGNGVGANQAAIRGQVTDPSGAVVPQVSLTLRNQTTGATRSAYSDSNGSYSFYGIQPGRYKIVTSSANGFSPLVLNLNARSGGITISNLTLNVGSASQTVEVSAESANVPINGRANYMALNTDTAVSTDSLSAADVAEGAEIGDLFQYALKQRITVLQNQSALVPIVQSKIDAEKVTIWNPSERVPLRAIWLKNSSGLTLDGGTFNIIEANAFAGEGVFKELKPDERRLLSYAADTAVRVKIEDDNPSMPFTHIRLANGLMQLTREDRSTRTYTVHNSDTTERQVVIEHPARNGWSFVGDLKPEESTETLHRFRLKVAAGGTQELKVAEFHPDVTQYALTNIDSDTIVFIAQGRQLNPAITQALQRLLAKKNEIASVDSQLNLARQELQSINNDQARLRENMKALKGSAEEKTLTQRYVSQLNQQEDRLADLNKRIATLETQRNQLNAELNRMAQETTFDESL